MVCNSILITSLTHAEVVLILILLEYGLQRNVVMSSRLVDGGLNPYSTGIWSATAAKKAKSFTSRVLILILLEYGLQRSWRYAMGRIGSCVLILILLEYGLQLCKIRWNSFPNNVLILILLEYGLQQVKLSLWSLRQRVLILILLEYGLQPGNHKQLQQ